MMRVTSGGQTVATSSATTQRVVVPERSVAPRIHTARVEQVTYVHAPPWFGLETMISAGLLWPEHLTRHLYAVQDKAEIRDPLAVLLLDLRGSDRVAEFAHSDHFRAATPILVIGDLPPPPALTRLGARVIGPEELVMLPAEVSHFFSAAGHQVTPVAAHQICEEAAGIPALVEAAQGGLRRGEVCSNPSTSIAVMRVAAQARILPALTPAWLAAAEQVAVRRELAEAEVGRLGQTMSVAVAEMLATRLLVPGTSTPGAFHLIPALQAAVLTALEADRDRWTALHRAVALERNRLGTLDGGLAAAVAAGDHALCADILDTWTMKFAFTEHRAIAQQVTMSLPVRHFTDRPVAALRAEYLGVLPAGSTPVTVPTTPGNRRAAIAAGQARRIAERTFLAMIVRRTHGRFQEAASIAHATSPLIELGSRAIHSSPAGIAGIWHLHAGISHLLNGDLISARRELQMGWRARSDDELGFVGSDLASKFALLDALEGAASNSRRWLHTSESLPAALPSVTRWIGYTRGVSRLLLAVDDLDEAKVEAWLDEFGEGTERDEFWVFGLRARVEWELSRAHPEAAHRLLDDAEGLPMLADSDGIHRPLLSALRADVWLAQGQAHPARQMVDSLPVGSPLRRTPSARLDQITGAHERVLAQTAADLEASDTSRRDRVLLHLIRASSADAVDDIAQARHSLSRVVTALSTDGSLRALTSVQPDLLERHADQVPGLSAVLARVPGAAWQPLYPVSATLVQLSEREQVVLERLAAGGTNHDIAAALHVSANTVKTQLRSLYAKLGVNTRHDALQQARSLGLVDESRSASDSVR